MNEENIITQFKVIAEDLRSDMKKMSEGIFARFDGVDKRMDRMEGQLDQQGSRIERLEVNMASIKEQVALLLEGQTEIRAELRHKVSYDDFEKLEKRVTRLEAKVA